jgi:hypothetical protein
MTATVTTTPADVEQLRKQNAMLLRALMRVKQERDDLAKQLATHTTKEQR